MKKRLILAFSLLVFLSATLLAQEEASLAKESLRENYQIDYARSRHFGMSADGFGKGEIHYGPTVEISSDLFRWAYVGLGFKMDYQEFYLQTLYRYTMPLYDFNLPNMGHSAVFRFGINTFGFKVENELEGGKIRTTENLMRTSSADRYAAKLGIQNYLSMTGLLYDDRYNRLELSSKTGFRYYNEVKEGFWETRASLKYRNRHPWGELGFATFGWHADKLTDKPYGDMAVESGINLWEDVLEAPFVLNQTDPINSYFNTVAAVNVQYRFYFLYPLAGGWRNLYLSISGGVGFGFRHGNYSWSDNFADNFQKHGIWWYGGTLGHNFHDGMAGQIGLLVNNKKELLILLGVDLLSFSC